MTLVTNARVLRGGRVSEGRVAFENGKIAPIPETLPDQTAIIDARGLYLSPGFIDIHSHGGGGYDFLDATPEAFLGAAALHAKYGTTTIIPTATSGTVQETGEMLDAYECAKHSNPFGADMPGIHLEGPYFSPAQCGAQDPRQIRDPDPDEYRRILEASDAILRWSAAPELTGAFDFADACVSRGVLPAIGHSDADYEVVCEAFEHGFCHITHLYSCMSSIRRRNAYRVAGVVESAYLLDGMTSELIADGVHLPKPLLQMAYRLIGPKRIALVTDSMRGAGMGDGDSILGSKKNGLPVVIEDGVAKLPDRSAFAGSVATADRLVRTMTQVAEVPLVDAVRMITETPATIMKLWDRGTLDIGKRADLVLFDQDINVKMTVVGGKIVYSAL